MVDSSASASPLLRRLLPMLALFEERGIAFVATSSPHPDFAGPRHLGRNLFANSIIALDAMTGRRIWHFQKIRHDIWDLDIPAPPNLVTMLAGPQETGDAYVAFFIPKNIASPPKRSHDPRTANASEDAFSN